MSARPRIAIFGGVSALKIAKEFILRDNRQWSCAGVKFGLLRSNEMTDSWGAGAPFLRMRSTSFATCCGRSGKTPIWRTSPP